MEVSTQFLNFLFGLGPIVGGVIILLAVAAWLYSFYTFLKKFSDSIDSGPRMSDSAVALGVVWRVAVLGVGLGLVVNVSQTAPKLTLAPDYTKSQEYIQKERTRELPPIENYYFPPEEEDIQKELDNYRKDIEDRGSLKND